ncbi:MAG: PKD-like domain-containing protein, partial [Bacteroidales bacterium]
MKIIKVFLLSVVLIGFINSKALSQCTVTGVSGSGFDFAAQCAPASVGIYYDFNFGLVAPPQPSYRVEYVWGDGVIENTFPVVQSKIVFGNTVYYVHADLPHTYPATGDCEYYPYMVLVDNGYVCPDSRQTQIVANWHPDNVASASGVIALNPTPEKDVCEGYSLVDFQFADASHFACNIQDYPTAQKPNHTPRYEQFVYGTNPVAGKGIPNLFIKVGVAQTLVQLTDASGVPVANSWTVDPTTGGLVAPYSTVSGYFEGPVVQIPVNLVTGVYSLNNTYPISFNGVGTVFQDQFQVTLRNWNVCNPWNGSQTNPNSVDANIATSLTNIVAAPPAPTAPNSTICFGGVRTLTVTSPPVGTINWYSDALLTTLVGTGINYTPVQTAVGSYNFWVVDKSLTGLLCQSLSTMVTLTINPLPNKPTVSVTGSLAFCFDGGITSVTLTANPNTPPAITSYQWYKNGTAVGGAVTNAITLNDPSQNGIYTVRTFGINPTNCPGPLSDPLTVTIYSLTNLVQPTDKTVCELGSTTFSASTTDPIQKWQWEVSTDGGLTWGNANNGIYYNGFNTNALSVVNAPLSFNGNRYRVQITTTAGGCTYPSNSALLTVNPTPAITPMTATSCSGGVFSASPVNGVNGSVPAGTTYTWTAPVIAPLGSITGGSAQGAAQANISQTLTNTTTASATATYTVTPLSGACTGATFTVTVTVNPKPTVGAQVSTICSGGTFTVTPGGVPVGTTYTWTAPVIAPLGSITGGSAQGAAQANISQTLTNTTSSSATATYTVTPVSGACTGSTFTVTVTVSPVPAVGAQVSTICSGGTFTVTPGGVPVGTTYTWTAPVIAPLGSITGGSAQGAAQANISQTLTNTTAASATATYTVTPLSGACTGSTFTVTVTVNPKPTVGAQVSTICSGGTFTVTPGGVPVGTTYTWTAPVIAPLGSITGGSAQGTAQANISQTLTNTTTASATATYTVTPLSGACTGSTFTVTVTVSPVPAVGAQVSTICSGGTFTVTPGGVPVGTTYTWTAPVIAPLGSITGGSAQGAAQANISQTLTNTTSSSATATYTVTPLSGSCGGSTFTVTVTVSPKPAVNAQTSTICSATAFTVSPVNGVDGSIPVGTTYTWAAPVIAPLGSITGGSAQGAAQANISQTLTNITSASATATYAVTPTSGGCPGSTFTVTVTVNPKPTPVISGEPGPCLGSTQTYTTAAIAGHTYSWSVNNGTISGSSLSNSVNIIWNVATGAGWVKVTETITATGCSYSTANYNINVNPGAPAGPPSLVSGATSICLNGTLNIDVTDVATASQYLWDYSWVGGAVNATTATSQVAIDLTGVVAGVYTVTVAGSNGCGSGPNMAPPHTFTIYNNPVANAGTDQYVCGTLVTALSAVPSVGTGTWTITSGPGTVVFSNLNSATSNATVSAYGTYVLRWTEVNGGICTSFDEVTVAYAEAANAGADQQKCGTLIATLAGNTPSVGTGTWTKISGPGTVAFTPTVNTAAATATVTLYGTYVF